MKVFRPLLFCIVAASSGIAVADSVGPSIYDANSRTLSVPVVAVDGQLYQSVQLHFDNDGPFSITSVGPKSAAGSVVSDTGAFVFLQGGWVTLPKVQIGADVYTKAMFQLQGDGRLRLSSIDGPATSTATSPSTAPVRLASAIIVPNEIAAIKYPESYSAVTPATIDQGDPSCDWNPPVISFPSTYISNYPLPAINGAPLDTAVERGVKLKDVWQSDNPTFNTGCKGDMRTAFQHTVARLKKLGADYLILDPWTCVDMSKIPWRILNPSELKTSTMGDADLEWAVAEIHKAGLAVHWSNQIQCGAEVTVTLPPGVTVMPPPKLVAIPLTEANVRSFLDAYEPYMLERASLLQRLGVDAMDVWCECWASFENFGYYNIVVARLALIVPKIKAVYSGKIRGFEGAGPLSKGLYAGNPLQNYIDYNMMGIWLDRTNLDPTKISVAYVKEAIKSQLAYFMNNSNMDYSKPIMWYFRIISIADFKTSFGYEESGCTAGPSGVGNDGLAGCLQNTLTTDFSFQAIFNEAAFEVIKEQTSFKTRSIEVDYWLTDNVLPSSSFPNIATSIRNKPAEAIAYQWFKR